MTEFADLAFDAVGQFLQPAAKHLVIVASACIPCNVSALAVGEGWPLIAHVLRIIHAAGNHAQRAGHEFAGARASSSMTCHIIHVAMPPALEPRGQVRFSAREIRVGDTDVLETKVPAPSLDRERKARNVVTGFRHRPNLNNMDTKPTLLPLASEDATLALGAALAKGALPGRTLFLS